MLKTRWSLVAISLVLVCASGAQALDIAAKKIAVKDNADPAKRQVQAQSKDAGILLSGADDPGVNGAWVHVYSATDNYCALLESGADWSTNGKLWKYKNKTTKESAQIGDGKLKLKLRDAVTFSLMDQMSQGAVNVVVEFGEFGTRYCMRCAGNKKDDDTKFIGTACSATACDAEPSICDPLPTTTTTAGPTTTSTTVPPGSELQGALNPTSGRFNYNLVLGVPGANAACNTNFPGTHACSITELQASEGAGDLDGLQDINANTVTSFWAIDPSRPDDDQCTVSTAWDYNTQHTGQFADKVTLTNLTGELGPIVSGSLCSGSSWVGCCL
jgi:hypothetical protein